MDWGYFPVFFLLEFLLHVSHFLWCLGQGAFPPVELGKFIRCFLSVSNVLRTRRTILLRDGASSFKTLARFVSNHLITVSATTAGYKRIDNIPLCRLTAEEHRQIRDRSVLEILDYLGLGVLSFGLLN